ncbi:MAG: hypothetical protein AAF658_17520, partial [Myxococcota bacterium]
LMERWKDRRMIRVSCVWPRFHQHVFDPKACSLVEHGTKDLEMNFRADRDAARVCAEVRRRVLCDYLTLMPLCVEYRDDKVASYRSLLAEVKQLGDEGQLRRHSAEPRFGEELALSQYDSEGVSSNYRVSPWSRSARIKLTSVPMSLAKQIAKLVQKHNATGLILYEIL